MIISDCIKIILPIFIFIAGSVYNVLYDMYKEQKKQKEQNSNTGLLTREARAL